ncbi:probable UDP-sugar transporter protein SLC35A4 [Hoplias malabaricus]|uniref:probable UDP-sugar transporter protein SLC35A4 n=1 Tax=Hoplias malabaricus TaxID=27720 RepID=UPI0034630D38
MIVIDNVGSGETHSSRGRRWFHSFHWAILLLLLVFIYGSHAPLIALTKVDGHVPFSASSCVVLIEFSKLLASLGILLATGNIYTLSVSVSWTAVAPYVVPALLYSFNNNLVVFMQAYMDPSSFQVLSNLKIASTALLYTTCLGKRLRPMQWLGLGFLMGAGVCHSYSSLDWDIPDEEDDKLSSRLHITTWGLLMVLLYCFISGLAAVYTERILKTQCLPLSLQNLFLYVFGVGINLASHFYSSSGDHSFLDGYSAVVWLIVAGQAANGLLMSVVMKHGTGITRLFVISSAMLVNSVLSWGLLGLQLTPFFLFSVLMIGVAVYLYYK